MRFRYDKSSKWLIEHHGDSILRLAGVANVESWRALQAELVQPRKLPDGLVEAQLAGRPEPDLFLIEVATFPENRLPAELFDDLMLAYLNRHQLPEVLTIVLHPKGNVRIPANMSIRSPLGWSQMQAAWRVVELWNLPAGPLLATEDPGIVPWVPLTQFEEPAETVLQLCREIIDRKAAPQEHENLLVVTQILAALRYNAAMLHAIFGGKEAMIESPVIQEIVAEARQKDLMAVLEGRFGPIPNQMRETIQQIAVEKALDELIAWSARCPSLEAFTAKLPRRDGPRGNANAIPMD
jgi:predicted transposase YdaD